MVVFGIFIAPNRLQTKYMERTASCPGHEPRKGDAIMELINSNEIYNQEEWISKGQELHERWKAFMKTLAKLMGVVGSLLR